MAKKDSFVAQFICSVSLSHVVILFGNASNLNMQGQLDQCKVKPDNVM